MQRNSGFRLAFVLIGCGWVARSEVLRRACGSREVDTPVGVPPGVPPLALRTNWGERSKSILRADHGHATSSTMASDDEDHRGNGAALVDDLVDGVHGIQQLRTGTASSGRFHDAH